MNGIIGAIVGNSIGQSYEIIKTRDYNFNIIYDKGNAADDSIAILAVADWLMSTKHDKDSLIDKLHFWCNKFNYGMYNYGNAVKFKEWIKNKEREPYNSFGNGSAMRVIPIGFYANDINECLELAKISAVITHNHPEGIKGAQAIASAIFLIRKGKSKNFIKKYIEENFSYNLSKSYDNLKKIHKFECTCQNSVPAALICWLESKSYEDAIRKAISLGGDADTEGAITGALASADRRTPVDDELVHDVIRFFSIDFLDLLNKWQNTIEKSMYNNDNKENKQEQNNKNKEKQKEKYKVLPKKNNCDDLTGTSLEFINKVKNIKSGKSDIENIEKIKNETRKLTYVEVVNYIKESGDLMDVYVHFKDLALSLNNDKYKYI